MYEDYKILYRMCVPVVQDMEKKVLNYGIDNDVNKEIIKKMDINLSEKASKIDVEKVYQHMQEKYASKFQQELFIKESSERLEEVEDQVMLNKARTDRMDEHLKKNIGVEVRKATQHLKKSAFEEDAGYQGGGVLDGKNIGDLLDSKVDKIALEDLKVSKANKVDAEIMMRAIEQLSKQIQHLS